MVAAVPPRLVPQLSPVLEPPILVVGLAKLRVDWVKFYPKTGFVGLKTGYPPDAPNALVGAT